MSETNAVRELNKAILVLKDALESSAIRTTTTHFERKTLDHAFELIQITRNEISTRENLKNFLKSQ
jgi:hypothetical protein